ncbi:ankyrin repeat protein [Anaeramoeba flamelloides]|uniref:Ankyrin repeat protein n=1 Tax=Anaeramoeba flamelloides TaxID=1746091 RepID=A0AAV7YBS7_9EUKA|nr:ankyrin repeat protein [Anaeramoeba flamelloides]
MYLNPHKRRRTNRRNTLSYSLKTYFNKSNLHDLKKQITAENCQLVDRRSHSILILLANNKHLTVDHVQYLVSIGTDIDMIDQEGNTFILKLVNQQPPRLVLLKELLKSNLEFELPMKILYDYFRRQTTDNKKPKTNRKRKKKKKKSIKKRNIELEKEEEEEEEAEEEEKESKEEKKSKESKEEKKKKKTTTKKDYDLIDLCISKGVSVDALDRNGRSILIQIIQETKYTMQLVEQVRRLGINVDRIDDGKHNAIKSALYIWPVQYDLIKLLIKKGANLDFPRVPHKYRWNGEILKKSKQTYGPAHFACSETVDKISRKLLRLFYKAGCDFSLEGESGKDIFQMCCDHDNVTLKVIKFLIEEAGVDVHSRTSEDIRTGLQIMCSKKNIDLTIFRYLCQKDNNLNRRGRGGKTTLHCLCLENQNEMEIFEILINSGANVNSHDNKKWSALHYLSQDGRTNFKVFNYLLDQGADINCRTDKNETPLYFFCGNPNTTVENAKSLLSKGAKIDLRQRNGNTLLHQVCLTTKNFEIIKFLVEEKKMDIDATCDDKLTPLSHLCLSKKINMELIKYFVCNGATINHYPTYYITSLFGHICKERNLNLTLFKYFLNNGVRLFEPGMDYTKTPGYYLLENGKMNSFKLLLDYGLKINAPICPETTSSYLQEFISRNNYKIVRFLFENGADLNSNTHTDHSTWFGFFGYSRTSFHLLKLLAKYNANLNERGTDRDTPLIRYCKAYTFEPDPIYFLLKNGAELNLKNNENKTALFFITKHFFIINRPWL